MEGSSDKGSKFIDDRRVSVLGLGNYTVLSS